MIYQNLFLETLSSNRDLESWFEDLRSSLIPTKQSCLLSVDFTSPWSSSPDSRERELEPLNSGQWFCDKSHFVTMIESDWLDSVILFLLQNKKILFKEKKIRLRWIKRLDNDYRQEIDIN